MNTSVQNQVSNLLGGAFGLDREAFQTIAAASDGLSLALFVVLFAGLSLEIGQSIVLFINRVKPGRFVFSVLLNSFLFTFGYIFLVFSTWLVTLLPGSIHISPIILFKVLGLAYAPLLFSFLGALPHLGYPLQNLFAVWNLLAMVVAIESVTNLGLVYSVGYVVIGWIIKQVLEGTIGQPLARFKQRLAEQVAGVDLADNQAELKQRLEARTRPAQPIDLPLNRSTVAGYAIGQKRSRQPAEPAIAAAAGVQLTDQQSTLTPAYPVILRDQGAHGIPKPILLGLALLAMAIIFVVLLIVLRPVRNSLFGWHDNLPRVFRWLFDLGWIGLVAMIFAGLLAPLETLGWWAGWFGEELDTSAAAAIAPDPTTDQPSTVSRFVVYLDGIGQSGEDYTPDVETFLAALKPALPRDIKLVQGLMMYSVLNRPLDEDRPLAFFWRLADQIRWRNPTALLGILLNLRNVFIVAVSADKRYGPIYNQGIAQVLFDGLIDHGYRPRSGVPITLIGYSGGGEMSVAAAPYLKKALSAPIDVISLGGVMSANNDVLKLEQLYHIVGEKDVVERIGPIIFPGRWKLFPLSFWNRAKRRGNISIISAGPVGHQVPGGYMDPEATLADGRSHLQHTIDLILKILRGQVFEFEPAMPRQRSHYELYQQAEFVRPAYYPLHQTVDAQLYRPVGDWLGRLILPPPEARSQVQGCLFEVYHTPDDQGHLRGQVLMLRWNRHPAVQKLVHAVTKDVHFSGEAEYAFKYGGLVLPTRLNHWQQVNPLESLPGGHPKDDLIVKLPDPVQVETQHGVTSLYISSTPVQITGRYYGLVQFVEAIAGTDQFRVRHFNPESRQFDGVTETVVLPAVMAAETYGCFPSTSRNLEKGALNESGWYIYGAKNAANQFVVQALAPRSLLRVQPDRVVTGHHAARQYILKESWADTLHQKGKISSVLCVAKGRNQTNQALIEAWQEGDRALVVHTYGGIGGRHPEPAARTPIFFGHFAYGVANVVREPLTQELRFDITYYQVYTHNTDGLVAGPLHWSRYMGDRQFGWAGSRPTCDLLIKLDAFTGDYDFDGDVRSPFNVMLANLHFMMARYRIGDGTGGTFVGPANNCSQDSNQALFASLQQMETAAQKYQRSLQRWAEHNPDQVQQFQQLMNLAKELKRELQPFGGLRPDWADTEFNLGSTLEDDPIRNLLTGLGSWRTIFPRLASDKIGRIFLKHGATIWVLRTNQIGGYDPEIAPIAPTSLSFF